MCIHCVTLGVALGIAGILVRWSTTLAVGYRVSAESHEHAARQGQCQRQPQTRVMVPRRPPRPRPRQGAVATETKNGGYGSPPAAVCLQPLGRHPYSGGGKGQGNIYAREAPIKHATKTVKHRGARGPSAQSELSR